MESDLQKALAAAQASLGSYQRFAAATQDQAAKEMFHGMAQDSQRHVVQLNARIHYLAKSNPMNQGNN